MKRTIGVVCILLPFIGILMMKEISNGIIVGDSLLEGMGISAWSRENGNGLHWSAIAGFVLLVGGYLGARRFWLVYYDRSKWNGYKLLILLFFIFYSVLAEQLLYVVKANASVTEAIGLSKGAGCNYHSEQQGEEAVILMTCNYRLVNYSGRPVSFELIPDIDRRPGGITMSAANRSFEFEAQPHELQSRAAASFSTQFRSKPLENFSGGGTFNNARFLLVSEGSSKPI